MRFYGNTIQLTFLHFFGIIEVRKQPNLKRGGNVMRNRRAQVSLFDTYKEVTESYENNKPKLFRQLDELIEWETFIPARFFGAFHQKMGRPRVYSLVSFLKMLVLQRIFGYTEDSQLLLTLRHSSEMRDFCELKKVPDAAKITRFKQEFIVYIEEVFDTLVEQTEPICRQMDKELADCLVFDTTGIESYVAENNPKFLNGKLSQAKAFAKKNPGYDPYKGVYSLMPDTALANSNVKRQYINGHFCNAQKAGILTNGLGIVRDIALFDEDFKNAHPEMPVDKREDDPSLDKEIGDAKALLPILTDFRSSHPSLHYSTFLGDAAFDSYDLYSALLGSYGFQRAVIPLNLRNSAKALSADVNESGVPLCPADKTPMLFAGPCGGKNRSKRLKFVCPKSKVVPAEKGTTRKCFCDVQPLHMVAAFTSILMLTNVFTLVLFVTQRSGTDFMPREPLLNVPSIPSRMFLGLMEEKPLILPQQKQIFFLLALLNFSVCFSLHSFMTCLLLGKFASLLSNFLLQVYIKLAPRALLLFT